MLLTIAFILIILWLFGYIGFASIGWLIHVLLIAAIVLVLIRIIEG